MIAKILLTLGVLVYTVVIPFLEINHSHVFNPDWPAHARLHEVWQLTTNSALGLFCLWLVWIKKNITVASMISIMIMGGVLFAHIIEQSYGGSILSGNTSKTILGLELAAFAALVVVIMIILANLLNGRIENKGATDD